MASGIDAGRGTVGEGLGGKRRWGMGMGKKPCAGAEAGGLGGLIVRGRGMETL